jgi:hypothetical protein
MNQDQVLDALYEEKLDVEYDSVKMPKSRKKRVLQ